MHGIYKYMLCVNKRTTTIHGLFILCFMKHANYDEIVVWRLVYTHVVPHLFIFFNVFPIRTNTVLMELNFTYFFVHMPWDLCPLQLWVLGSITTDNTVHKLWHKERLMIPSQLSTTVYTDISQNTVFVRVYKILLNFIPADWTICVNMIRYEYACLH